MLGIQHDFGLQTLVGTSFACDRLMRQRWVRILVVDGDRSIRRLYEKVFRRAGYDVLLAASAMEAAEKFLAEKPDLVVLDAIILDAPDFGVLSRLFWARRAVPVILNSIFPEGEGSFIDWTATVTKSSDIEPLQDKVRKALTERETAVA